MKKRTLILFGLVPFLIGLAVGFSHGSHTATPVAPGTVAFQNSAIAPTDVITLSDNGNIFQLTATTTKQITQGQNLIEPVFMGSGYLAITKTTNYASLDFYDNQGNRGRIVYSGNTGNVDTMHWISDPAIDAADTQLAYVSDRDSGKTGISDNALYLQPLSGGTPTVIGQPDPHSGGIAHPVFSPINRNLIFYDYYQYDGQTYNPYSTIYEYDSTTGNTVSLTDEKTNAYQEALSPDGKQILFLGRNEDNAATLYLAQVGDFALSHPQALLTGDIAYPQFSYTLNTLYFLQATKNTGYDLMRATIVKGKLTNVTAITTTAQLLGSSSYTLTPRH